MERVDWMGWSEWNGLGDWVEEWTLGGGRAGPGGVWGVNQGVRAHQACVGGIKTSSTSSTSSTPEGRHAYWPGKCGAT